MNFTKKRYFDNSKQPSNGIVNINPDLYKARVMQCVEHILQNLPPILSNCEGGLYVGIGGVAYALYYLCKSKNFPEQNERLINAAKSYIDVAIQHCSRSTDMQVSLLLGNGGIYMVAALIYNYLNDKATVCKYVKLYRNLKEQCKEISFLPHGSDEIFVGRAGYLFGAYLLQRDLGTDILSPEDINTLCKTIVQSGKEFRAKMHTQINSPLMYQYHGTLYLGAGHGLSGILQALLTFPEFYKKNAEDLMCVKATIDFLISCIQDGNVAPTLEEVGSCHRHSQDELVHWCHGSPGLFYAFARAYMVFNKDKKYLEVCENFGECIWKKGLLKKGPGICHGVAGNGYIFLNLYRLTGDLKHLYRAERFAGFMFTESFSQQARTPDCPFSLYEGLAGTACFLNDLLQPDKAEFPLSDIFIEFNNK